MQNHKRQSKEDMMNDHNNDPNQKPDINPDLELENDGVEEFTPGMPGAEEASPSQAESGKDAAQQQIETLQAELDKAKDQMMRALADAENTRRRSIKDREDIRKYAVTEFARDLLDFSDNFRRALDSIPEDLKDVDDRLKNVLTGIEAMESTLLKTFDKHGIKKIEPLDEPFNPNFHEVMFESPGTGKPPGTIVQIIEPGYVVADRLLRPARVGIAKDDGGAADNGGGENQHGGNIDTQA